MAHPPRSKPPLRSSSGPPNPCITPSTETLVVVVNLISWSPPDVAVTSPNNRHGTLLDPGYLLEKSVLRGRNGKISCIPGREEPQLLLRRQVAKVRSLFRRKHRDAVYGRPASSSSCANTSNLSLRSGARCGLVRPASSRRCLIEAITAGMAVAEALASFQTVTESLFPASRSTSQ